jgi:hypothetical protein
VVVVEESRACKEGRFLRLGHVCRLLGVLFWREEQRRRRWLGHACIIICSQAAAGSRIGVVIQVGLCQLFLRLGGQGVVQWGDTASGMPRLVAGVSLVCRRAGPQHRDGRLVDAREGGEALRHATLADRGIREADEDGAGRRICIEQDMEAHPGLTWAKLQAAPGSTHRSELSLHPRRGAAIGGRGPA